MFTGIIESTATLIAIENEGTNRNFKLKADLTPELKIDQSLAHNGVCLTITKIRDNFYWVTAIEETLKKSNLGDLEVGDKVNLERSMKMEGRLDGHIVQGHVDQTALCTQREEKEGSWEFTFEYVPTEGNITVEKGSITVNGVSLTVVNSRENSFSVAIIPYTYEYTNFHQIDIGHRVNLEFDVLGKYVFKYLMPHLENLRT